MRALRAAFFASTCTLQAHFSVRDSLFGDANDSKGLSAVQRRLSDHLQILVKGTFLVYDLQKGGAERTHSMALAALALSVYVIGYLNRML